MVDIGIVLMSVYEIESVEACSLVHGVDLVDSSSAAAAVHVRRRLYYETLHERKQENRQLCGYVLGGGDHRLLVPSAEQTLLGVLPVVDGDSSMPQS